MDLNKKISRIFKFVLSLTMAMAICMGSFIDANRIFKISAAGTVATLTIHSDPTGGYYGVNTGTHSFLSIRNRTNSTIYVLNVPVTPKGSITIGTYGNQNSKYGNGIYTNLDAYLIKYKNKYKQRLSLSTNLVASELNTVQKEMRTRNKHTWYCNCSWFAATVWNTVAPKNKRVTACGADTICNPKVLAYSISLKKEHKKAAAIGTCDKTDIRRIWTQGYLKVIEKDIVTD